MAKVDFWNQLETKELEERWAMAEKAREREAAIELVMAGIVAWRSELAKNPTLWLAHRLQALQTTHTRLHQMANPRMALDTLLLVL